MSKSNASSNSPQANRPPSDIAKESNNQANQINQPLEDDFIIDYETPVPWWKKPIFLSLLVVGVAGLSAVELLPVDSSEPNTRATSSDDNILKKISQGEVSANLTTASQTKQETSVNNESVDTSHGSHSSTHINAQNTTAQRINQQDIAIIRVDNDKALENTTTTITDNINEADKPNTEQATLNASNATNENQPQTSKPVKKPANKNETAKVSNQTVQASNQTNKQTASDKKSRSTQQKTSNTSNTKAKTTATTTANNKGDTSSKKPTSKQTMAVAKKQSVPQATQSPTSRSASKPATTKAATTTSKTSTTTSANNKPKQPNQTATQALANTTKAASQKSTNSSNKTNASDNKSSQAKPNPSTKKTMTTTKTKPAENADKPQPKPTTEISLSKEQIQKIANRLTAEQSAENAIKQDLN